MKTWFSNLKFRYKLLIGMIAITTIALLLISRLSYSFFYQRNLKEVHTKAENSVKMATGTLSTQLTQLAAATNHLLVKAPFPEMISDINSGKFLGYSSYYSAAVNQTDNFLQSHGLVNNLLLCGERNILFTPSALSYTESPDHLFPNDLWSQSEIVVMPTRYNNLFKQGEVIPISYPITANLDDESNSIVYRDKAGKKKVRFVVLLDTGQIRTYFNQMSNSYTYSMYLADREGNPLDITQEKYPDAFLPEVKHWVQETPGFENEQLHIDGDELFVAADSMKFCGLKVVHLTRKTALMGDVKELKSFFIAVWLVCTLVAALLAFALSHLLTRKVKVLAGIIDRINHHDYEEPIAFPHSDEISLLGTQLNQMYDTIQLQLVQIQEEEQQKARAEIQMMSEQIKPHFLYNTLECIHFQILNGHTEAAGGMLESLGRYLRTTLSVGSPVITIEKEVEHVTSYMEIMNRHSPSGIRFTCRIAPELASYKVMKIILQPLAENCIKHGFGGGITGMEPVPPQITITITPEPPSVIRIEVADNGMGIDIEKAASCLNAQGEWYENQHFGLHNIYKRLKACYGDGADMTFMSIPYFKNSVIITLPWAEG